MDKDDAAFRTISEAADELDVPQHVLRFWETRFAQIKPLKRGGGRRFYRPADVELLRRIRHLLYAEGYTIRGVQKLLKDGGARPVRSRADEEDANDKNSNAAELREVEQALAIDQPDITARARAALALIVEARAILERSRRGSE